VSAALVIDAGVAVKWVIEEEGTPQALALLRHALAAPDLLVAECANILRKKVRLSELSSQEANFAAGLLARADIELMPMRPHLQAATKLAIALDHPAYDCVYIVLAEAEGVRFVTADARLLHKIASHDGGRLRSRVVALGDSAAWQGPLG
jgi:predicted nucleic acid-binding protein